MNRNAIVLFKAKRETMIFWRKNAHSVRIALATGYCNAPDVEGIIALLAGRHPADKRGS